MVFDKSRQYLTILIFFWIAEQMDVHEGKLVQLDWQASLAMTLILY